MVKVLIIGGSGHVSGAMTRECLKHNFEVTIVTRGLRPMPAGVTALQIDRKDPEAMRCGFAACRESYDAVIDCICFEPAQMALMLELFRERTAQLLFISTDFVFDSERRSFPQPDDAPMLTDDRGGYQGYGWAKRQCEQLLLAEPEAGLNWTTFRPCHIYGAPSQLGCFPTHCRDTELLNRLKRGETLTLVDGGHFLQQPLEVNDLARCVVSAIGNPAAKRQFFSMVGLDIVESWQYYQMIADYLKVELKVRSTPLAEHLMLNPGERPFCCHRVYRFDHHRAANLVVPSTPLAAGLQAHAQWLLDQAAAR